MANSLLKRVAIMPVVLWALGTQTMARSWDNRLVFPSQGAFNAHSQKRHKLAASYQQVAASPLTSSSCSKSVKIRLVATWCLKQLASSLWIKSLNYVSTCSKPVDNLQQTCYHQAGASDVNASWYQLDDSKVTSLQQTCCNLRVSGLICRLRRLLQVFTDITNISNSVADNYFTN